VFEGEATERQVWLSLNRFYLNGDHGPVVYGIYGGEIYSLFHKMKNDPDLDLFSLLKESPKNNGLLDGISKEQVSEIYLFFDYDGHAPAASDDKLNEMLNFFNEETDNGKLYLSYPMVEALRHLHPNVDFSSVVVDCKRNIRYKHLVSQATTRAYHNVGIYTDAQWQHVISEHCKKLQHLMVDEYELPDKYYDQPSVFAKQLEKHIEPNENVAVLSAFPVFLLDYYGHLAFGQTLLQNLPHAITATGQDADNH
jgi:hypothetical protein